jgi:phosphoglycerate dehydrogenase-like enzyme
MVASEDLSSVVCLRPRRDFENVGVEVPDGMDVAYFESERDINEIGPDVRCLVLPSAGPALAPELFRRARALELVQYTGAGIDRISDSVIGEVGCAVCNIPGASAPDVAAYVVLTVGLLLRKIMAGDRLVKAGQYGQARALMSPAAVRGFRGLVVGVVGFGGIGYEVSRAFYALGARVLWYDPAPAASDDAGLFERVSLEELLHQSEVITVHVPLMEATRGMIDAGALAKVREGAIVVNAARGGIVDEEAIVEALDSGHLAGVVLDVYQDEPLGADSPLLAVAARHAERVIMTPHIAGVTPEASRVLFESAWDNVHAVIVEGQTPRNRLR